MSQDPFFNIIPYFFSTVHSKVNNKCSFHLLYKECRHETVLLVLRRYSFVGTILWRILNCNHCSFYSCLDWKLSWKNVFQCVFCTVITFYSPFWDRCSCFTFLFDNKSNICFELWHLLIKSRIWLRIIGPYSFMICRFGKYKSCVCTLVFTSVYTCMFYKICL